MSTVFTPDSSLTLLFPSTLIPKIDLPSNLHLRSLSLTDHSRSHLLLLSTLTDSPSVSKEAYETQINYMLSCPETYYSIVIVNKETDQLIACGTLVLERKFIRNLGKVGHVEDITVSKEFQGKGLGKVLLKVLVELSENLGAYKCILDCSPENEAFYVKCGYYGVEALFANLSSFGKVSIRISFIGYVYPCLILAYLGQGARLIVDGPNVISNVFFQTIPGGVGDGFWYFTFVLAILAAIIASQD